MSHSHDISNHGGKKLNYNFIENRIPNKQSSFSLNKVFQNCFKGGMCSILREANSMLHLQSQYTEGQNSLFNFQIHSGQ